jgi:hypothetical protein
VASFATGMLEAAAGARMKTASSFATAFLREPIRLPQPGEEVQKAQKELERKSKARATPSFATAALPQPLTLSAGGR